MYGIEYNVYIAIVEVLMWYDIMLPFIKFIQIVVLCIMYETRLVLSDLLIIKLSLTLRHKEGKVQCAMITVIILKYFFY